MTHQEVYKDLKEEFGIDEACTVVLNEGDEQAVYSVTDEEGNYICFDFDLVDRTVRIVIDPIEDELYELETREF